VLALSGAGIFFILFGLLALGLPASREGALLWELNAEHALSVVDAVGAFAASLGVALTWLSGMFWQRQMYA
jgi:hypothetical protein